MKDIILNPNVRKNSQNLLLNLKNLPEEGKYNKNEISKEATRQIQNVYSTKKRKISLDQGRDFYDEFLIKFFGEEKTDYRSYITPKAKVFAARSSIKTTKKINTKRKETPPDEKKIQDRTSSRNLNNIIEKVFEIGASTTEDKNKIQTKYNKINNVLLPLYENKTQQENINKISSQHNNKAKNNNQYYKCLSEQNKIDKDEQHRCFWNKIMCCLAFSSKHTS